MPMTKRQFPKQRQRIILIHCDEEIEPVYQLQKQGHGSKIPSTAQSCDLYLGPHPHVRQCLSLKSLHCLRHLSYIDSMRPQQHYPKLVPLLDQNFALSGCL